ncbi:unnamed protein product [Caenorhabditis bovis]|uniref:CBM21 domain-containing protein n=1 Tax=Caenorhabditis bovis TaxID=2654633 RepID=A0A8S1FAB2_9PELO|nr:unnamed protein product [Caenorhabditis bovis]
MLNTAAEQRPDLLVVEKMANLVVEFVGCDDVDDFLMMQSCSSEPCSPDSGFSSDDGNVEFNERFSRSKTLPSALRRSRSKQCEKRVRFADSLGLDLENHHFVVEEDLSQTFDDIHISSFNNGVVMSIGQPRLVLANFTYRSEKEYNDKTRSDRVCVSALRAAGSNIVGQVNLLNVAFDKNVIIRYTTDDWSSQNEIPAAYSHRMFATDDIDAFNFTIAVPLKIKAGRCEFCVQYTVGGQQFWDNNDGHNYVVDIAAGEKPSPRLGATSPMSNRRMGSQLPAIPCPRSSQRRQQRRWGKSVDESDDECCAVAQFYIPGRRSPPRK